ncbi:MAG: glycosyltransferase family 39 protein [Anaerolineae bacterium]|nr:glycosyltransferase family 39 protein [Anaerolineae bacterium]
MRNCELRIANCESVNCDHGLQRINELKITFHVSRFTRHLLPLLLLLIYFAQSMLHIHATSISFDEGPHLAIGYATLRTGDFRIQPIHIHPPLANVLAAAPLLLQDDLPDPRTIDGWEIASLSALTDTVIWQYPHPARIATAGRVPILLMGVLLGAIIFRWTKERATSYAGIIALTLYAFDPNFIAHNSLITTDTAAVLLSVATLYIVEQMISKSTNRRVNKDPKEDSKYAPTGKLIGLGALIGLAQLAKVSALMLIPVVGFILLVDIIRLYVKNPESSITNYESRIANYELRITNCESRIADYVSRITHHALRIFPHLLRTYTIVFLTAFLVVWAGYKFEIAPVPGFPIPLPAATHIKIYQSLQEHYTYGHPTFLMGRVSTHGWWWYFPIAFLLKTPLPILIFSLWLPMQFISDELRIANCELRITNCELRITNCRLRVPHPESRIQNLKFSLPLILFPCLYTLSSLLSTVNIGYRHLLPILPFLYIGIGTRIGKLANQHIAFHTSRFIHHVSHFTFYILLSWLILGTLLIAPNYLTFFNALAGGAAGGYRYLVDSNLDWGQNLWDLKNWMENHNESHVYYAHYSPARPQVYGINADFLPPDPRAVDFTPWDPTPGLYAIGATVLQGPYAPDHNTYAWFRTHKPTAILGNALWVYQVPARPAATWAVVCPDIVSFRNGTLSPDLVIKNLGQTSLRILQPDCISAYVYAKGTEPGLYAEQTFQSIPPATTLPDIQLRAADGTPTYNVYRITGTPTPGHTIDKLIFDGPLTFLGYTLTDATTPATTLELLTYWRVDTVPGRPLSLMAHLISPDGTGIAVSDGLGFPIEQWQPGDIFIQRHPFEIPTHIPTGDYSIYAGAYWLDTMERWPIHTGSEIHDHISIKIVDGE